MPVAAPALERRVLRAAALLARAAAWVAGAVAALLLLAWLALHWAILPHIERWRPAIERETGKVLGVAVRVGAIEVRAGGWMPAVELRDVVLLDASARPALHLGRVVATISARSLLASAGALELRLAQLLIDGAQLDVRRDAAGRLFVAGLDFSGPGARGDGSAADWFFRQQEIAILGATLRWTDEQRGAPPLELDHVDLVVRGSLRRHSIRLDATPPPGWGERFSLRAKFTQPVLARAGDWQRWSGEIFADLPRADAGQLRHYVDLPFELSQGTGAVRAWLEVRAGLPSAVTLDLALRAVELRLAAELEPLRVEQLRGRLAAQRRADGGSIALRGFSFVTGDGVAWPEGDLELKWTQGPDGVLRGGSFSAERLDLALIADTAARLPLGAPVRKLLAQTRPEGIANAVRASWDGPLDALAGYRVSAKLSALSIAAKPSDDGTSVGRPGLRNASIALDATDQGGQATLAMQDGALELPGVFAEPVVPLDALDARLVWRIAGDGAVQVRITEARLANADAQAELGATWKTGPGEGIARGGRLPGQLELDAMLTRGVAARGARYLPLGLSEGTRRYVERAVRGGVVSKVEIHIDGDLWDFPRFAGQPGQFRVAIAAEDLTLAYVPSIPAGEPGGATESPWPPMTQVSGELVVDRASLVFRNVRARVLGVELDALQGGIADLAQRPLLTLETRARGPLADMLRFVNVTPVGEWIHGALRETTAAGTGDLKLALRLPLQDLAATTVTGSLQLAGNELRIRRDLPLLAAARGRVDFTPKGLTLAEASARVLGGEATFDGGTQPDGSLRLNVQGTASAEALRRTPELGAVAQVAEALTGQTTYRLGLGIGPGAAEIDLTSDLVGLASELPAPLAKRAETPLPLHLQTLRAAGTATPQDSLRLDLGAVVHAQFARDLAGDAPRVLRGGIGVFEPAPTPAAGVAATVNLPTLDVDAWGVALSRLFPTADAAAPAGYTPTQIGLKVQELTVAGRRLNEVAAGLSELDGLWRATVDATQLSGYVEVRPAGAGGAQPGRILARLARLSLPKSEADEVTRILERQPASVPALDIVIDDLELRGRRVGRLEVVAVNRTAPEREWELTRLKLALPEAQLNASGHWAATPGGGAAPGQRQADFKFELDIADSGALLTRFGNPDAIRGGKGRLEGQVGWIGSPLQIDFPSLTGEFRVEIEQGQFLQAQTGAARLLGVLSLQSLARRLTLDFRDVFLEGFAFDSVTGDVQIARGVASTRNLLMRGAQAAVLVEGSADAERETQDLRVYVVPEINVGAVSLAYAVINPVIGLGTFLAQLFLREPLIQANTREFRITGSWADPQVEQVARASGQAVPSIGPPAAAASAPPPPSSSEIRP